MRDRLLTFIAERHPFAVGVVAEVFDKASREGGPTGRVAGALASGVRAALRATATKTKVPAGTETTPGVTVAARLDQAADEIARDCEGFLHREAIAASLTPDERVEILRGML